MDKLIINYIVFSVEMLYIFFGSPLWHTSFQSHEIVDIIRNIFFKILFQHLFDSFLLICLRKKFDVTSKYYACLIKNYSVIFQ